MSILEILSILENFVDSWKLSGFLENFPEFLFKCYNSEFNSFSTRGPYVFLLSLIVIHFFQCFFIAQIESNNIKKIVNLIDQLIIFFIKLTEESLLKL